MAVCVVTADLPAQEANCREVAAVARMARARSMAAVDAAKRQSGESYRAHLVYAHRAFQLHGTRLTAETLLKLLPADEGQQTIVVTLGDSLCDREPLKDMRTLSRVNETFAREVARAVILSPKFLPSYVAYSLVAVNDPHSDFAVRMSRVCQQDHSAFLNALKQLPDDKRHLFAQHVMDADHCKALARPEASY